MLLQTGSLSDKLLLVLRRERGLRTAGQRPVSSEQVLEHALRVSEVLRSEYTEKQSLALDAIHTCRRLLHEERNKQQADVETVSREKDALLASVSSIRHKLLTVQSKQSELSDRVAAVLSRVNDLGPRLTPAETEMRCDLQKLRLSCGHFSRSLTELCARHQFQTRAATHHSVPLSDSPAPQVDQSFCMSSEEQELVEHALRKQ